MTKTKEEIFTHTKQVLNELFELDESLITPEARLYEDLDIDSIDAVDMLIELKKFTGSNISPEHFKEAKTLQDIVDTVHQI